MIYLLTWRNYLEKLDVHIFDTPAIASTWDALHGDAATSSKIISEPMDIDFAKKFMIDLYNALGKPEDEKLGPNGFNNRTTGQDKIFDRLSQHFKNLPVTPAAEQPAAAPLPGPEATTQEIIDMATKAKVKRAKKVTEKKAPRAKKPVAKKTPRGPTILSVVENMVGRNRGASKKEIIAEVMEKFAKKATDEVSVDNTVRGLLSVLGRRTGTEKVTKAKDEKRGNVYTKG